MPPIGGLLTWLAGLGGLAGAASLLKVFFDRTKIRTDAVDQIADTSVRMLGPLHEEIDRLSKKLRVAESELDALRQQMRVLSEQHDEAEALRAKAREAAQEAATLRAQIARLYGELDEKDRAIVERDRLIAALRAEMSGG